MWPLLGIGIASIGLALLLPRDWRQFSVLLLGAGFCVWARFLSWVSAQQVFDGSKGPSSGVQGAVLIASCAANAR